MLAGHLHVAARTGEVELAAAGVEVLLAVIVGGERARVVRDLDVHRLAARGEGHVGGDRRHIVLLVVVRLLAVLGQTLIDRHLEGDDLARLGVEVGIVLTDADALVREAIGERLAVLELLGEQGLALVDRDFVRRELLDRLPLLAESLVHGIRAIDEIVQRYLRKGFRKMLAESLEVRLRIGLLHIVSQQRLRCTDNERERYGNCAQHSFLPYRPIGGGH